MDKTTLVEQELEKWLDANKEVRREYYNNLDWYGMAILQVDKEKGTVSNIDPRTLKISDFKD